MGFWEGLLKFGNEYFSFSPNEFDMYKEELYDAFSKDNNKLFGNFSRKGFDVIFELLIGNAKESINIFCKNYDVLFDESNFILLKFIAEKFERTKGEIFIFTYGEESNEKFVELEKDYSSVKYVSVKFKDKDDEFKEVKLNNAIVVDDKRYWLEDTIYNRNNLNDQIKACCNFNDIRKCVEILTFINKCRKKAI